MSDGAKRRIYQAAYRKAWRIAHPEEERARRKSYYDADPDKARARVTAYRVANPEKVRTSRAAGHIRNRDKELARSAAWKAAHPEKVLAQRIAWLAKNADRVRAYTARYSAEHRAEMRVKRLARYQSNPEKYRAKAIEWRNANIERARAKDAAWAIANPEKERAKAAIRRARLANANVPLTKDEKAKIVEIYRQCRLVTKLTGIPHHVDHRVAITNGGKHHPDNLQLLTATENVRKGGKMKWRSLGCVFHTEKYAQTPTPLVFDTFVRVYFAERYRGQAFIRFVDLDIDNPAKIIGEPSGRVLENGDLGTFDCRGQMPSCAINHGSFIDIYYSGWLAPAGDVPYHNSTGVARSTDGGLTFERLHAGPILDRTPSEPYLAVTPCIVDQRMWYITGLRWEWGQARYEPIYGIAQAILGDGDEWRRDGKLVIPQSHPKECFSRPWVTKLDDRWRMWYCFRSAADYRDGQNAYQLGYATSADGWTWTRRDDEMRVPRSDWDSTMQCYPAVFEAKGKLYMVYNGASFGRYGFGLAIAE